MISMVENNLILLLTGPLVGPPGTSIMYRLEGGIRSRTFPVKDE